MGSTGLSGDGSSQSTVADTDSRSQSEQEGGSVKYSQVARRGSSSTDASAAASGHKLGCTGQGTSMPGCNWAASQPRLRTA